MSYSDPKYNTRVQVPARFSTTTTLTATASGHAVTATDAVELPNFIRRTAVTRVHVKTVTAGVTTVNKLIFLNGTDTMCTVTVAAAGTSTTGTPTGNTGTFTAGGEPTVNVLGTGTASAAQASGTYDVWFEQQELYS
jgi:hypothetical protein